MKRIVALLTVLAMMLCVVPAMAEEVTGTGTAKGFGGDVTVTVTLTDGVITAVTAEGANETTGIGSRAIEIMPGAMVAANSIEVDGVSGATMTTSNYRDAVKDALNSAIILGGGSVDIRSEEQILADNLAAALPAGDTFTEVFVHEALTDVTAIYAADNGAGSVYVTGEGEEAIFVGVGADGYRSARIGFLAGYVYPDVTQRSACCGWSYRLVCI